MTKTETQMDPTRVEKFGEQLVSDTAAAVRGGLLHIGDKLGIFKAMAGGGHFTTAELSSKTGLNQRYLQEWLSAMVTGKYIEYDPKSQQFRLPAEHAVMLADESSPMFAGGLMGMVVPLISKVPDVAEAFKHGGGVSYKDHHPDMAENIERFSEPIFKGLLTAHWLPAMTDIHQKLTKGCRVVDVGCGTGGAVIAMAKAYPNAKFVGVEPFGPAAARARKRVVDEGLTPNIVIEERSGADLPTGEFDLVTTFDVIHDLVDPLSVMKSIKQSLAPGGTYLMLEMNASDKLEENMNPLCSLLYSVSTLYCMTVSLAEGGLGLGSCMGEGPARKLAEEAGFTTFRRTPIEHPFSVVYELK